MDKNEKNSVIRRKGSETRVRRKNQTARVFELKLDKSKISNQKTGNLKRLFLEGKWFTNHIIAKGITDCVSYTDYKVDKVNIKVGDKFEERDLNVLPSQMKQYIIKRLQSNVKTLQKLDKKGRKTGKIRYRKALHSMPLMQYGITYEVDKESKSVHIQGLGDFKVKGLDQMPTNTEMTTANLMEKDGDYFLHVTTYALKEERVHNKKAIGIDLGIKNQVAFSNGIITQYAIPASKRKIRLYKVFSRAKYDQKTKQQSKRRQKALNKIKGEFSKENNMKRDINNKLASYISNNYEFVAYQNDCIHAWQKLYGKRIYQTSIGEFRNVLKRKASTPMEIDRFIKTTGICMGCNASLHLNLSDRMFTCPFCGHISNRDVSAASTTINKGLSLWDVGETLEEDHASVSNMLEYIKSIPHVKASIADETRSSKQTDRQIEALSVRAG